MINNLRASRRHCLRIKIAKRAYTIKQHPLSQNHATRLHLRDNITSPATKRRHRNNDQTRRKELTGNYALFRAGAFEKSIRTIKINLIFTPSSENDVISTPDAPSTPSAATRPSPTNWPKLSNKSDQRSFIYHHYEIETRSTSGRR